MLIDVNTRILGILGYPLGHSLSPIMHNRALQQQGLNYVYLAFEVERNRLAEAVQALRVLGVTGVNVTVPFKEAIMVHLDELTEEARMCGAVNVVKNYQGRLVGSNTDGPGFMAALQEAGVETGGQRVVILGAGGAARAVAYSLARTGVQAITFLNRTYDRAVKLADFIGRETGVKTRVVEWGSPTTTAVVQEAALLVNTTAIGMFPDTEDMPPLDELCFHPGLVVSDVVYNPRETRLLRTARSKGLRTVDGVGMLVYQGALAYEMFTGAQAPVQLMSEVISHHLAKNKG